MNNAFIDRARPLPVKSILTCILTPFHVYFQISRVAGIDSSEIIPPDVFVNISNTIEFKCLLAAELEQTGGVGKRRFFYPRTFSMIGKSNENNTIMVYHPICFLFELWPNIDCVYRLNRAEHFRIRDISSHIFSWFIVPIRIVSLEFQCIVMEKDQTKEFNVIRMLYIWVARN